MKFFKTVGNNKEVKEMLSQWSELACQCMNSPKLPEVLSLKNIYDWATQVISDGEEENNPPVSGIVIGAMRDICPERYYFAPDPSDNNFHHVSCLNPWDPSKKFESLVLYWVGTWTNNRYVQVQVTEENGQIYLSMIGRTGTCQKSRFLSWWIERSDRIELSGNGWQFCPENKESLSFL